MKQNIDIAIFGQAQNHDIYINHVKKNYRYIDILIYYQQP